VFVRAGEVIDRYRIVGRLGAGGMGEVYQAVDTRLERSVALKLLRPVEGGADVAAATPGRRVSGAELLLREARAAAALTHPNVVAIYDVGVVEHPPELRGTAFLAMELIEGRTLRAVLREGTASMQARLGWLADVARALDAAHARGLVHRDVKPENVMLGKDGVVKVLDFGIAKRAQPAVDPAQATAPASMPTPATGSSAIGTPYYMAPEQMRGEPLDGRADQFSWAVMAYELLAGRGPWRTDAGALALVSEVLSKPVESVRAVRPDVPEQAARVIARALGKNRDERYPSMGALLQELGANALPTPGGAAPQAAGSGPPHRTTAAPLSYSRTPPTTAPASAGSRRGVVAGVIVAVLVLGGFAAGAVVALRGNVAVVSAPTATATTTATTTATATATTTTTRPRPTPTPTPTPRPTPTPSPTPSPSGTCASNEIACGGKCLRAQDPDSCGHCGNVCKANEACTPSYQGMFCDDCGAAGKRLARRMAACDRKFCYDLDEDSRHCGACFHACAEGQSCWEGACRK
jgi:serine/threonine protein kinase